jgi:flavin reductase (DIM6/NTAB) family NADH-FMN oxidoreductase RutF
MKLKKEQIEAKDDRERVLFINSLSGFKSANLVGTANDEKQSNLAIVSSVVHLGANPALLGMVMRPHSVPRGTLENIINTGVYTLNHVNTEIYQQAHQTSARYPEDISEFNEVGLNEQWEEGFAAPFVKESHIKLGMKLREKHHLAINVTEFLIGEIISIEVPDELVSADGFISLEKANTVAVSSLDTYHSTQLLGHLSYAKPNRELSFLDRES